jgi:phosphoserine aminotransferase
VDDTVLGEIQTMSGSAVTTKCTKAALTRMQKRSLFRIIFANISCCNSCLEIASKNVDKDFVGQLKKEAGKSLTGRRRESNNT